jgi:predicted transcriptional regulator
VISRGGSEVVNFRVASDLVDQLDAAADTERTTRKVIITRALAQAGFRVQPHDLEA